MERGPLMLDADSLRVLARGFGLAEGPVVVPGDEDAVIVTDVITGGLYRVPLDATDQPRPEAWAAPDRRGVGGLVPTEDGGLLATGRSLVHVVPDGTLTEVVARAEDLTGFNDLAVAPDGGVIVGGLRIRPALGELDTPGDVVHVLDGRATPWAPSAMTWPNGIAFTPDGGTALIADFATGTVHAAPWEPGRPAELTPFVTTPSGAADGMSVDEAGNLWVALGPGGGVAVYAPDASLLGVVAVPDTFVTSVCHAGPDRRTLVITTMDSGTSDGPDGAVLAVRVDVAGAPALRARVAL